MDNDLDQIIEQKNKLLRNWILNTFLVIGFVVIFGYIFLSAPLENKNITIHVSSGQSVSSILLELKNENAIRSELALKIFIKLLKRDSDVISGDYLIKKDSPVWVVAWQLSHGYHNIEPIKITFREGLTNEQIALILAQKLPSFQKDLFLSKVEGKQGYLFPDTYFFYPLDTTEEIVKKFSNDFEVRTRKISAQAKSNNKDFSDILIMASILEGEAGGPEDIKIISGILWKRISLGMPLQVDIDKSTYTQKGLPNNPLNNPGLVSIEAALTPESSSYLYYLHDKNGRVHYASNFEEHKININNYLK